MNTRYAMIGDNIEQQQKTPGMQSLEIFANFGFSAAQILAMIAAAALVSIGLLRF